jgi:site-specific DNA recombinase
MVSIGNRKGSARLQCGTFRESGSCTNSRKVNRDAIEAAVFAGLKDELSNPIAVTEYINAYNDERCTRSWRPDEQADTPQCRGLTRT